MKDGPWIGAFLRHQWTPAATIKSWTGTLALFKSSQRVFPGVTFQGNLKDHRTFSLARLSFLFLFKMKLGKLGLFCVLSVSAIVSVFAAVEAAAPPVGKFQYEGVADSDSKLNIQIGGFTKELSFESKGQLETFVGALQKLDDKSVKMAAAFPDFEAQKVTLLNGQILTVECAAQTLKLTVTGKAKAAPAKAVTIKAFGTPSTIAGTPDVEFTFIDAERVKLATEAKNLPMQLKIATAPNDLAIATHDSKVYAVQTINGHSYLFISKVSAVSTAGSLMLYGSYIIVCGLCMALATVAYSYADADGYQIAKETSGLIPDWAMDVLPEAETDPEETDVVQLPTGQVVPRSEVVFDVHGRPVQKPKAEGVETTGTAEVAMAALMVLPFLL